MRSSASVAPSDSSRADTLIRAEGNYFGQVTRRFDVRGLHMSETVYATGARIPAHEHECPSFFMPLGGTFVEGCCGTVRHYHAGDVGYHPAFESHWLDTQGAPGRGFAIEIGATWRDTLGGDTDWRRVPRDLSHSDVSWMLGRLYRELHIHDSARALVVEALGVEIGSRLSATTRLQIARTPGWLHRVRDVLHDAVSGAPTLRALADVAGVTPVAVIKAFRRHEGCTPGTYLRTLRLANARRALANSHRPLSAIALEAGFYDQSHFTRAFKAASGVTPRQYRAMLTP